MTFSKTSLKRRAALGALVSAALLVSACGSPDVAADTALTDSPPSTAAPKEDEAVSAYLFLADDGSVTCSTDVVEPAGLVHTVPSINGFDENWQAQLCEEARSQISVEQVERAAKLLTQKADLADSDADVSSLEEVAERLRVALESNWVAVPALVKEMDEALTPLLPDTAPEVDEEAVQPKVKSPAPDAAPKKETKSAPKAKKSPTKAAPKPKKSPAKAAPKSKKGPKPAAPQPTPKKAAPTPKKSSKPAAAKPAPKKPAPKKETPPPSPKPKEDPKPSIKVSSMTSAILKETNKYRANAGLSALKAATCADGHAQSHSKTQASTTKMHHQDLYPILDKCNASWVGENVAYGQKDAAAVTLAWFNSPGHKANMLQKDTTHMAAAVAYTADGVPYYTQIFVTM